MLHLLAEAVAVAVQLWVDAPNRSPHLGLQQLEVHRRQLVCFRELHIGLQHCNFTSFADFPFQDLRALASEVARHSPEGQMPPRPGLVTP